MENIIQFIRTKYQSTHVEVAGLKWNIQQSFAVLPESFGIIVFDNSF